MGRLLRRRPARPARRRARAVGSTWLGAHLLLHLGIIGVAIGVSRFVTFHPGQDIPTPDVAAVAIPLAEIYLALIVINLDVAPPTARGGIDRRSGSARSSRSASIVVLAEWATWFDTYWSVAAFALVAIVEAGVEARVRRGHRRCCPAACRRLRCAGEGRCAPSRRAASAGR